MIKLIPSIKKLVIIFIIFFGVTISISCTETKETPSQIAGYITVKGSEEALPMMMEEAYAFMDIYLKAKILVLNGGSNYGLAQVFMDSAQIAVSTRQMSPDELERAAGFEVHEFKIAKDGLAIVVNPVNPVGKLTVNQVKRIFSGEIRSWSEVKGPNWSIKVHLRDEMSGTFNYFKENILEGKGYAKNAMKFANTESMFRAIYKEKGAVGIVSMSRLYSSWSPLIEEMRVKELAISSESKGEYIFPDEYTVHAGTYPFVRYIYLYTAWEPKGLDAGFITFIMSAPGQKVIAGNGFVPITVPVKYQDSL